MLNWITAVTCPDCETRTELPPFQSRVGLDYRCDYPARSATTIAVMFQSRVGLDYRCDPIQLGHTKLHSLFQSRVGLDYRCDSTHDCARTTAGLCFNPVLGWITAVTRARPVLQDAIHGVSIPCWAGLPL